jgi:hypothetical protein
MSHLIHVLEVKKAYTEQGVFCPEEQSHMLNEAYIRAGLAVAFKSGGVFTADMEKVLYHQLEKWNSVSPINGRFIHQSILTRINLIAGSMANTGSLPCAKQFTLWSKEGEVDASKAPGFSELVGYLIKELESCHE